ncbi:hypothetical protein PIB30_032951 [Stylosanthes scabra]|uniref:Uncharacterized protein n=1 Tax=Stylosanthes scabra TaxID=79078 RepID=A0ABU6YBB2_9FABA|nr:hypothetical protein [Stylosanthes scabra]
MDQDEKLRKCSNMKCQRVQVDESSVPAHKDEVMEVDHFLAENRNEHVSADGGLDIHAAFNGKDDLEMEVLDGFLDDVEIDDLEGTDVFSGACEEYLFDFEFDSKAEVLGPGPCEGSLLQNSTSESHSSELSGSSSIGAFRNNPHQPSNEDCLYNISLDIPHLHQLDNDNRLAGGILYCKKETGSIEKSQPTALKEKRCRKPTRRYIEESSDSRSKEKVPTAGTKRKHSNVTSCDELHIRIKALRKIRVEKSSNGISDATIPKLKVRRGRPKKEKLYEEEPVSSESEDECLTPKRSKKKDRRKHQRMWTAAEVIKLVDGISEYGVGRWTDIKRFSFSSSSYRTPIDLRDKWRNLLRASSIQTNTIEDQKEDDENDDHGIRPLPSNVACRVRELAKIHPYPRQRGSKNSRSIKHGTSTSVSQSKDSPPICQSKRNVRRKCTYN